MREVRKGKGTEKGREEGDWVLEGERNGIMGREGKQRKRRGERQREKGHPIPSKFVFLNSSGQFQVGHKDMCVSSE